MELEKYIKSYLLSKGTISLPNIGTFKIENKAAFFSKERIEPPKKTVTFDPNFDESIYDDFCQQIARKENANLISIRNDIEYFTVDINRNINALKRNTESEVIIENIGTFILKNEDLVFKSSNVHSEVWDNSFGFSSIPYNTYNDYQKDGDEMINIISNKTQNQSSSNFLVWLIIVPLLILSGIISWVIYTNYHDIIPSQSNEEKQTTLLKPIDTSQNRISESLDTTSRNLNPFIDTVKIQSEPIENKDVFQKSTTPEEVLKKNTRQSHKDRIKQPKQSLPKSKTQSDVAVNNKQTIKSYYLIIASFTSQSKAEEGLAIYQKEGYSNIGIIAKEGKYRIYWGGAFTTKQEAFNFQKEKGVEGWPLKH